MKELEGIDAFNVVKGDIISFTGGGGKSSLIFSLAESLSKKGRVLITTTTKIYIPSEEDYEHLILTEEKNHFGKRKNIDFLGNSFDLETGKILGVDDRVLMKFIGKYDYILIEADGSAGKSMKYWNRLDPVISKHSNKIIGVVNLDVVGKKVEDGVHRYKDFCELFDIDKSKRVDSELLIKYLKNAKFFGCASFLKSETVISEKFIFINGVENWESFNLALLISREINFGNIIIGSIKERELYPYKKITAILLASGLSDRMGRRDKLFMNFKDRPLVSYIHENISKINFHKKIRVIRDGRMNQFKEVAEDFGGENFLDIINQSPEKGQGHSIKIGTMLAKKECETAYMFFTGDQPLLKYESILSLIKEFMKTGEITLPTVDGQDYSPVIFPYRYSCKLSEIEGDKGGKSIIQPQDRVQKISFQEIREFLDIDTSEDFKNLS
ncbi:MAG: selenium cofactor biosynthesis protein YqeC [Fusobacteriaceae bacterium]